MEVVRKVMDSELIGSVIELPKSFRHTKVEVLVLPHHTRKESEKPTKSLYGVLAKYANPSLIEQEADAWAEAAAEKHANS